MFLVFSLGVVLLFKLKAAFLVAVSFSSSSLRVLSAALFYKYDRERERGDGRWAMIFVAGFGCGVGVCVCVDVDSADSGCVLSALEMKMGPNRALIKGAQCLPAPTIEQIFFM